MTLVDCPQVCRQTLNTDFLFFSHGRHIDIAGRHSILSTWRCFCQRDREVDTFASDDQGCLRVLADGSQEGIGEWRHIIDL